MKTPEDEAFDELARKQGDWGGGFPAKRAMAADKLHWSDCAVHNGPAYPAGECDCGAAQKTEREALKLALEVMQINLTLLEKIDPYKGQEDLLSDSLELTHEAIASIEAALAQPEREPVACERCKQLEEQAYDLLGQLKVANLKWSVAHPWVGLTDEEIELIIEDCDYVALDVAPAIEQALKEKNNGT